MTFLQSIILGIIQGITEFLPISSSAHLVLIPYLLNWHIPANQVFPFDVLVQLGTLVAVIFYFWKDLVQIIKGFFKGLINKEPFKELESRMGWMILLATIPAMIAGLLIKSLVENVFSSATITAALLFVTAALLILADRIGKRSRQLDEMTWWDALWIGLFQAISIFPGISRSGATISGGMTRNLDRTSSARFSFLLSIPVMLGASLVSLSDLLAIPNLNQFLPVLLVGFLCAVIVGYLAIHWLLSFIKGHKLWYFAVYCAVLATSVLLVANIRGAAVQPATLPLTIQTSSPNTALYSTNSGLQLINLQYSNSLSWLIPTMSSCANLIGNTGLITHNMDTQSLSLANSDLILRWGPPQQVSSPAYQLGTESLVIVVNAANPLQTLPVTTARQVFAGTIDTWGALHTACPDCFAANYDPSLDNQAISLAFYPVEEDIQSLFSQLVMANQPVACGNAIIVPDPIAMNTALASSAGAIGFLPAHAVNSNVKAVSLSGIPENELLQPILALTSSQPQGKLLDWLTCIQKVLQP